MAKFSINVRELIDRAFKSSDVSTQTQLIAEVVKAADALVFQWEVSSHMAVPGIGVRERDVVLRERLKHAVRNMREYRP